MRIRRIVGTIALTTATVTSFVMPASAASAAGSCGHAVFSPDGGAMACFNPTGEHLFICDTDSDGHHPGAWYVRRDLLWHNVQYDLSAGNCHDLNLDMAESESITYYACNYEGTEELGCSSWATVSANG